MCNKNVLEQLNFYFYAFSKDYIKLFEKFINLLSGLVLFFQLEYLFNAKEEKIDKW